MVLKRNAKIGNGQYNPKPIENALCTILWKIGKFSTKLAITWQLSENTQKV